MLLNQSIYDKSERSGGELKSKNCIWFNLLKSISKNKNLCHEMPRSFILGFRFYLKRARMKNELRSGAQQAPQQMQMNHLPMVQQPLQYSAQQQYSQFKNPQGCMQNVGAPPQRYPAQRDYPDNGYQQIYYQQTYYQDQATNGMEAGPSQPPQYQQAPQHQFTQNGSNISSRPPYCEDTSDEPPPARQKAPQLEWSKHPTQVHYSEGAQQHPASNQQGPMLQQQQQQQLIQHDGPMYYQQPAGQTRYQQMQQMEFGWYPVDPSMQQHYNQQYGTVPQYGHQYAQQAELYPNQVGTTMQGPYQQGAAMTQQPLPQYGNYNYQHVGQNYSQMDTNAAATTYIPQPKQQGAPISHQQLPQYGNQGSEQGYYSRSAPVSEHGNQNEASMFPGLNPNNSHAKNPTQSEVQENKNYVEQNENTEIPQNVETATESNQLSTSSQPVEKLPEMSEQTVEFSANNDERGTRSQETPEKVEQPVKSNDISRVHSKSMKSVATQVQTEDNTRETGNVADDASSQNANSVEQKLESMSIGTSSEQLNASKSIARAAPEKEESPAVPAQSGETHGTSTTRPDFPTPSTTASLLDSGEVSPSVPPHMRDSVQKLQRFLEENPDVAQLVPVLPIGVAVPVPVHIPVPIAVPVHHFYHVQQHPMMPQIGDPQQNRNFDKKNENSVELVSGNEESQMQTSSVAMVEASASEEFSNSDNVSASLQQPSQEDLKVPDVVEQEDDEGAANIEDEAAVENHAMIARREADPADEPAGRNADQIESGDMTHGNPSPAIPEAAVSSLEGPDVKMIVGEPSTVQEKKLTKSQKKRQNKKKQKNEDEGFDAVLEECRKENLKLMEKYSPRLQIEVRNKLERYKEIITFVRVGLLGFCNKGEDNRIFRYQRSGLAAAIYEYFRNKPLELVITVEDLSNIRQFLEGRIAAYANPSTPQQLQLKILYEEISTGRCIQVFQEIKYLISLEKKADHQLELDLSYMDQFNCVVCVEEKEILQWMHQPHSSQVIRTCTPSWTKYLLRGLTSYIDRVQPNAKRELYLKFFEVVIEVNSCVIDIDMKWVVERNLPELETMDVLFKLWFNFNLD
ncbi:hypothetical protein CAEBREN_14339 [Caenorhabditis brenneri]|uniref:Uncharacterized protein n=1 Tax=Caenorhabditis brenneri TaxID=135651 RepID=G0MW95_CAEBE|nr:hypothetical protein CAEBREN_14339 [Caenorhabditis brenneri]